MQQPSSPDPLFDRFDTVFPILFAGALGVLSAQEHRAARARELAG